MTFRLVRWFAALALPACGRLGFGSVDHSDAPIDVVPSVDVAPTPNLVAWFAMEAEPALGSVDSTGNGNDATCSGTGCPIRVPGIRGSAVELDGIDDRFVVPDSPMLRLTTGFTVTLWAQWYGGDAAIVTKPQALGTGASFEVSFLPTSVLSCTDDTIGTTGESCLQHPMTIPVSTWIALALTWDGALRTLFVDGQPVLSSSHGVAYDDSPLIIGGDEHDQFPSSFHHGRIDELRIYDRALSAAEIAALHTP